MANKKISQLIEIGAAGLNAANLIPVVSGSTTYKTSLSSLDAFLGGYTQTTGIYEDLFTNKITVSGISKFANNAVFSGNFNVRSGANITGNLIVGSAQSITSSSSSICGGSGNILQGNYGTIGGGVGNQIYDVYNFIGGGLSNSSQGSYCFIGGGQNNLIQNGVSDSNYSIILGADNTAVDSSRANIIGHSILIDTSLNSSALGTSITITNSPYSLGLGRQVQVDHSGAGVLGDGRIATKGSAGINTFTTHYSNGVYVSGSNVEVQKTGVFKSGISSLGLILPYGGISGYLRSGEVGASVSLAGVPATTGSAGTSGNLAIDINYLYACIGTNRWKRVALSDF